MRTFDITIDCILIDVCFCRLGGVYYQPLTLAYILDREITISHRLCTMVSFPWAVEG